MFRLIVFWISISAICAHEYYQTMIPNGKSVPDPCNSGRIWLAVGHYNPTHHTHDKNQFAIDFAANGHMWTVALCQMDSDGDGKSNGEELGDPSCVWTVGATPSGSATGHPGICISAPCKQIYSCGCHGHNCAVGK